MCLDTTHPFVFVLTGRSIMEQTSQPFFLFFLFREMKDKKWDDDSMSFSFPPTQQQLKLLCVPITKRLMPRKKKFSRPGHFRLTPKTIPEEEEEDGKRHQFVVV
jgi:hypothetical protein